MQNCVFFRVNKIEFSTTNPEKNDYLRASIKYMFVYSFVYYAVVYHAVHIADKITKIDVNKISNATCHGE